MTTKADIPAAVPSPRRLDPLRGRLDAIRRRRRLSRRLTGWSAVAVALLAALLAAFAIDRTLSLPLAGRLWLWAAVLAVAGWAFRRHAWPLLRIRETDLDVALSMEKAHGIDSDFVAALQFEGPESAAWGSPSLRAAVVDYVSEFGRQWTVDAPVWNRLLAGRVARAAALLAVFVGIGCVWPATLGTFIRRMGLESVHYPTATRIERLVIAGREIDPAVGGAIASPAGRPLRVEAVCGGRKVAEGRIEFAPLAGGGLAAVPLAASREEQPAGAAAPLVGELPNLTESAVAVVRAGDAWSEPVRITAVPLPVVEASLRVEPPAYARSAAAASTAGRQVAVLEGSSVTLEVDCLNKELASAEAVIDGVAHPLARTAGADGRPRFVLSGSGSPLAAVTAPLHYEVRAVDVDGLSPDRAPAGAIRIRTDAPPQVAAEAVTRAVLPTARPAISYSIKDDYGIGAARLNVEVIRDPGPGRQAATPPARTIDILAAAEPPWTGDALPRAGTIVLPLDSYGLRKGDSLRIVVTAVDHRGAAAGQASSSGPIDLAVTDENGILESLQATETQAAEELQVIIDEQVRVGEKP